MKKLLPIFVILSSMLFADQKTYPNEPAQSMRYSSLEVENKYFYMGFENITPKIGYRYQKNEGGLDLNFGVNGLSHSYFVANLEANVIFFPKPNLASQLFLGIGASKAFVREKCSYSYPKTYRSYDYKNHKSYEYTIDKVYTKWENYFTFNPKIFIGKDYSFPGGNKIFFQISFVPGYYSSNTEEWEWTNSLSFKIGYGF